MKKMHTAAETVVSVPSAQRCSYPTRPGNTVRPLIDGEPAFRRICDAIASARRSVWVTVTFMWPTFEMPDGLGSALDVFDRAAARRLDVRLLFWRPDAITAGLKRNAFWGSSDQIELLEKRRSGVKIRWDCGHPGFCQHQKTWLVDAGTDAETAFVGGINLNPSSVVSPGHEGEGHNHDAYVELTGPATVDVHHNFVQRWNEASERALNGGRWGQGSETDLPFPMHVPPSRGQAIVQIQRTIHRGLYFNGSPSPGGRHFDIGEGEQSNFDQYCAAIGAARHCIYIENQYVEVQEIVDCLHAALQRGVEVVLLMPAEPDIRVLPTDDAERTALVESRAALARHVHFTFAGIAGLGADGQRKSIYVHDKLMLIDDEWGTVGSCNLHGHSLFGNSELNVAFWDPPTARNLRIELLNEHLGQDTSALDGRAALQLFRQITQENRLRSDRGDPAWQGLACAMDLATYGQHCSVKDMTA